MLEWNSESRNSEFFFVDISIYIAIHGQAKSNHFTPRCACAVRGKDGEILGA